MYYIYYRRTNKQFHKSILRMKKQFRLVNTISNYIFRSLRSRGSLPSLTHITKDYDQSDMDPDIRTIVKKSLGKKYIRVENDTLQILLDQADKEMVNCLFDIVLRVFNVNILCI